jgi:hypothetical protein
MDRLGTLVPQILDHFVEPLYGQVCLSDRDAELPWRDAISGQQVLANESAVVIPVADEEAERPVELEVYLGDDEAPQLRDLQPVFSGSLTLSNPGLLVFTPTGEEVLLPEIREGPHQVTIYWNGYPTSRLVVLVDGRR